jgi:hypothetical protein
MSTSITKQQALELAKQLPSLRADQRLDDLYAREKAIMIASTLLPLIGAAAVWAGLIAGHALGPSAIAMGLLLLAVGVTGRLEVRRILYWLRSSPPPSTDQLAWLRQMVEDHHNTVALLLCGAVYYGADVEYLKSSLANAPESSE